MAPRGPSRQRAVRTSRATCRRGAPLDASFGDHARRIKMPRAAPGKQLMLHFGLGLGFMENLGISRYDLKFAFPLLLNAL
jgi:hypothetical protein